MTLCALKPGEEAVVTEVRGDRTTRCRLGALGFHPGDRVVLLRHGRLAGPVLIGIHGTEVAIAREQAEYIDVQMAIGP